MNRFISEFSDTVDVMSIKYDHYRIIIKYDGELAERVMMFDIPESRVWLVQRDEGLAFKRTTLFDMSLPEKMTTIVDTILKCPRPRVSEMFTTLGVINGLNDIHPVQSNLYSLYFAGGCTESYMITSEDVVTGQRTVHFVDSDLHDSGGLIRVPNNTYAGVYDTTINNYIQPRVMVTPLLPAIDSAWFSDVDTMIDYLNVQLGYL